MVDVISSGFDTLLYVRVLEISENRSKPPATNAGIKLICVNPDARAVNQ